MLAEVVTVVTHNHDQSACEPRLVLQQFYEIAHHVIGVAHRVADGFPGPIGGIDIELWLAAPERIVITDGGYRRYERTRPPPQLADSLG
jgi:hypothetical protein